MTPKSDNTLLRGNVGEWSELYVFLRLLSTGRIDIADERLQSVPEEFYRVLAILREEASSRNEYARNSGDTIVVTIKDSIRGTVETFPVPIELFTANADLLLERLQQKSGTRTVAFPDIQQFMQQLRLSSIKKEGGNCDITIRIEELRCGFQTELGFSIKSFIGSQSTLFNAGTGTNFIYRVTFPEGVTVDCDRFNKDTLVPGKIGKRLLEIKNLGGEISFAGVQSDSFLQNLRTLDDGMPSILAHSILYRYAYRLTDWTQIVDRLNKLNPMGYSIAPERPVYEYKIKRFLLDASLGMTAITPWTGFYESNGGQIVVKNNGDIVCYRIQELNKYLQYLFDATCLEQASTGEDQTHPGYPRTGGKHFNFGWLYREGETYYIKLNLQVRYRNIQKSTK